MLATTLETSQQQRPIDAGVLRPLVQSYVDHLAARGYRPATIHSLESRARHFCSWLVHSDIAASSINNDMIEQFARHMVALSTYLGHTNVTDTYWYLEATPIIMGGIAEASEAMQRGGAS